MGQNRSTTNTCQVDDDGLYVNGMVRVRGYAVSIVGKEFRLRLNDGAGNAVYEFKKTVQVAANSSTPNVNNPPPSVPAPSTNPSRPQANSVPSSSSNIRPVGELGLEPGRYVFLVLARRDLPRRFCTITANKISYTACNAIEHSFMVTGKG